MFIVGAPRSGTTLLRNMLNRHPAIGLCDETYYWYYVYTRRRAFGDLTDLHRRRRLVDRYLATNRVKRLGLPTDDLAVTLIREGDNYASFFAALMRFYARHHGKRRCGEKTPHHAAAAATLIKWYPASSLIHLVRDPRDVAASLRRMPWGSRNVLVNARLWLASTTGAHRCRDHKNYLLVRYEMLVTEPEQELRRICTFIGEEYTPAMLAPDEGAAVNDWWFKRAGGRVSADRIEKWREELSPAQASLVEWVAWPPMQQFGYDKSSAQARVASIAGAILGATFERARGKLAGLPRLWYYWMQPTQLAAEEAWIDKLRDQRADERR